MTTTAVETERIGAERWIILLGLITAAIMEVLDTTIVNVALPQMAGNLGATQQEISWVSTGYILSNVVVLPMTAFFTERFGRRRYLTASIILFAIASFLCGTSHSLESWCSGASFRAPAARRCSPPRRPRSARSSPASSRGWSSRSFSWASSWRRRSAPRSADGSPTTTAGTGASSSTCRSRCCRRFWSRPSSRTRRASGAGPAAWTGSGISLLTVGLGALQYVLEEGNADDWFNDPWILRLSIVAGLCLLAMLWWELTPRNPHPVVNFRILKNRQLAASIFLFVALGFGLYGGVFIFPLFTQSLLHFTPTETGLALLPGGLATAMTALICGRLLTGARPLVDPRVLIAIGVAIFVGWRCGIWAISPPPPASPTSGSRSSSAAPASASSSPRSTTWRTPASSRSEAQQAAGLINLARQLGGSFGIAILATYITVHTQIHRVDLLANVYPGQRLVDERVQAFTANLIAHGYGPDAAHRGAHRAARPAGDAAGVDAELQRRLDAAAPELPRRRAGHPPVCGEAAARAPAPRSTPIERATPQPVPATQPERGTAALPARRAGLQVFLAHPGGPFWRDRDAGAWTIPKGIVDEGEELLAAACREFEEETGIQPAGPFIPLGSIRQKAGKVVHAWAWEGDADAGAR